MLDHVNSAKKQPEYVNQRCYGGHIMDEEFREFLDHFNKINYAKADRLKSKKDGEAEALIYYNFIVCNVTRIVYKVEVFR